MKITITLFLFLIFSSLTMAASSSIIGTWSGKSVLINWEGKHQAIEYRLKFTDMKDNYVTGIASWKSNENNQYSVGEKKQSFAEEKFIGTYDKKSNTYYLVEVTEHSMLKIEPLSNGEINVIYLESGKYAVVFNGVLKKE